MSWSHLPAEMRIQILKTLANDESSKLANAAAVSREWQAMIEPFTFTYIRLPQTRIGELNAMTQRNRHLVKYIWFCIELERYDCSKCDLSENESSDADNQLIMKSVNSLFTALSAWEKNGQLTLDISLYSISDREHAFRYLTFLPDAPGQPQQKFEHVLPAQSEAVTLRHRWVVSEDHPLLPQNESLERLFENIFPDPNEEDEHWERTPEVSAVSRLVMRLQNHRALQPQTIKDMLDKLTGVLEFHFEPWRQCYLEVDAEAQESLDEEYEGLLEATEGFKKVTIFENFNEQFPQFWADDENVTRPANIALGQKLARVNRSVEMLSVSFILDGEDFFSVPPLKWPNLTNLALTSRLLSSHTHQLEIENLLIAAATAARRMPKLKTMEIWNGLSNLAALFKYEFVPGSRQPATITWRATWLLNLHERIIKAWKAVTQGRNDSSDSIDVRYEIVEPEEIKSHADAIVKLKLSEMVIRPVSLQQIQIEQDFLQAQ